MSTAVVPAKQPMSAASIAWYATLVLIPVLTAAMLLWIRHVQVRHLASRQITSYGKVPDFQLTNQDGQPFGLTNLRGQIWIADFIYSTCPGPCPMISTRMGELQKPLRNSDVQLVSFTVDPEKDTPQVLRTYADNLNADSSRWNFLTGPRWAIYTLIRDGFKLGLSDGSENSGQPIHSTRVALVDRTGEIRGYYDLTEADAVTKLVADTNHLLRLQPQNPR
jgi:cytochrome oxidase Cu insertion factor (SCO1/SenC/PrrC family)